MELTTKITSICPVCNKTRYYKAERSRDKNLEKPCRACANSISRGGIGVFFNKKGERFCNGCKKYCSKVEYHKESSTYCKSCANKRSGTYIKNTHRYSKYGIVEVDYLAFLKKQKNACAICKQAFTEELKPRIDHDHKTKKVRGVLCHHCNVALGHFKDDIKILKTTIKYLENGGE